MNEREIGHSRTKFFIASRGKSLGVPVTSSFTSSKLLQGQGDPERERDRERVNLKKVTSGNS
jgi:hypothetical protein